MNNNEKEETEEEWRTVLVAPRYEVSNHGRCRNASTHQIMKIHYAFFGHYPKVSLMTATGDKPVMLARQVLLAFTDFTLTDMKAVVGYRDNNNQNLHLDNLFWKSQTILRKEAWRRGAWKHMRPGYRFTREDTLKAIQARKKK